MELVGKSIDEFIPEEIVILLKSMPSDKKHQILSSVE